MMDSPRFFKAIDDDTVVHARTDKCLTIQQGNLIGVNQPDSHIFLERESLERLRDAINEYLTA